VLSYARRAFPPVLTDKLNSFRTELLAAHGSVAAEAAAAAGISPSASGTSTPISAAGGSSSSAPAAAPPAAKASTPAPALKEEKKKVGGTAVVQAEANLQASADDLWGLLTDQNRIPMWSRSPAKVSNIRSSGYSCGSPIFFSHRRPLLRSDPSASASNSHFQLPLPAQHPAPVRTLDLGETLQNDLEAVVRAIALGYPRTSLGPIPHRCLCSISQMTLQPGADFELFDKNVRGKIVSSDPPKQLVQSWQPKSPNWPSDHFATLTITLNQGSDSTAGEPSGLLHLIPDFMSSTCGFVQLTDARCSHFQVGGGAGGPGV
jgi:hypothetical protein